MIFLTWWQESHFGVLQVPVSNVENYVTVRHILHPSPFTSSLYQLLRLNVCHHQLNNVCSLLWKFNSWTPTTIQNRLGILCQKSKFLLLLCSLLCKQKFREFFHFDWHTWLCALKPEYFEPLKSKQVQVTLERTLSPAPVTLTTLCCLRI